MGMGQSHRMVSDYGEEAAKKYPHYPTYMKCQSKAFTFGTFSFISAGATLYLAQELVKKRLPYGPNAYLVVPVVGGSIVSYIITRKRTKHCQDMWMALEEKSTYFKDPHNPTADSPAPS